MVTLMRCGHIAQAHDKDGKPACVICIGITPGAEIIQKECAGTEGLEGRTAKCAICGKQRQSEWEMAFFEHLPNKPMDEYYCGCIGWD